MNPAPDVPTLSRTVASHDESLRAISDTTVETKIVVDRHTIELSKIKTDMADVKTDLKAVKIDLAGVKADLAGVKIDLAGVKGDLAGVKAVVDRHTIQIAKIRRTLKRHDRMFAQIHHRMDRWNLRMDHMEGMLGEVLRRLPDPAPG